MLRSFDFRNDFVLAIIDSKTSPESYNLQYILSRQYYDQGDLQKAEYHAKKSVALFPQITNYTNLGAIYLSGSLKKSFDKINKYKEV